VSHLSITDPQQLRELCEQLQSARSIAVDTEFVSERTYRPVLCLVQVGFEGQLALIDAQLVKDMRPFWEVLAAPGHETVMHAGRGEVEFSIHAVGRPPAGLFDVQVAAGLVGIEYPAGYGTLVARVLGEAAQKEETRTDWRHRPLSPRQIQYALDDIRYLSRVRDALHARLQELGRAEWMAEEMAAWVAEIQESISQERWRRVSGNSGFAPRVLAIVRELWRWRDAEAQRRNCPPRRVLRDDLIIELARRQTADPKRVQAVRGLERHDLQRQLPKISEAIDRALGLPEEQWPQSRRGENKPRLSVLGQFLFSALGSIARQMDIAPGLVGSPNDVRDWISYRAGHDRRTEPLLCRGWRARVIGSMLDDLLAGRLAVRVGFPDREHPLVFEPVPPAVAPPPS
jgi:ribonuclease D